MITLNELLYSINQSISIFASKKELIDLLEQSLLFLNSHQDAYEKQVLIQGWERKCQDCLRFQSGSYQDFAYPIIDQRYALFSFLSYQFLPLHGVIDFKEKASYLLTELKDKFSTPKSTSLISPEQITTAIEIVLKKVPIFTEINLIPRITTFTFPYQYKNFHSFIVPFTKDNDDTFHYHLFTFHMIDHSMNPIYSFLFQLGNILAFDLTHHNTQIPSEFYPLLEEENIDPEDLTEEEAHTFFCDAFAASMLYQTEEESMIASPFPKSFMETFSPYFEQLSFEVLEAKYGTVYHSLLRKVKQSGLLPITELTESLAKQLFVLEKKTPFFLTSIFDAPQKKIETLRKKLIGRVFKDYVDEKILWKTIYYNSSDNLLVFSVSLLSELKKLGCKEIYCASDTTPRRYQTLFFVDEELRRKKV